MAGIYSCVFAIIGAFPALVSYVHTYLTERNENIEFRQRVFEGLSDMCAGIFFFVFSVITVPMMFVNRCIPRNCRNPNGHPVTWSEFFRGACTALTPVIVGVGLMVMFIIL